ncbi:hypothetical protein [Neorhizobium sp. NCHU2750]|uniref:hypothetical protein n=1 Tax=Neorhizobium sp. NCHU2750 TaxID=1825976 RepID=UPI000E7441FA|nr:hypothetical protein NCHU2750_06180 [Neorhizobium sp. NCHU2750]
MDNRELTTRIFDLEAQINGLMIYIAAKEAGITLDLNDPKTKEFIKANVARDFDARAKLLPPSDKPGALAGDGYWDGLAAARIPTLVAKLQAAYGK